MKSKLFRTSSSATDPDPAHWVAQHADYLYSYALTRLEDEESCRDLVQETFLAALEKLADFKGQSSERTWLTAILKYKIIDVYRKRNASWLTTIAAHDAEPEFFELATETICRELKITPANFWVIIHRAKVNLRACIQKEGG